MAGHPQSSAHGLVQKDRVDIGQSGLYASSTNLILVGGVAFSAQTDIISQTATYVKLPTGITLSAQTAAITQDASDLILPGGVKVSNKKSIRANSTGYTLTAVAAKPATDCGACFTIISNSTGVALAINSTGGTWKYLNVTSVQPT